MATRIAGVELMKKKLEAITTLLNHGHRDSEWLEAGSLRAVDSVVKEEWTDLSSRGLKRLIQHARVH